MQFSSRDTVREGEEEKMENEINPPRRLATYDIFIGVELTLLARESVKSSCGNLKQGERKSSSKHSSKKKKFKYDKFPDTIKMNITQLMGGKKV